MRRSASSVRGEDFEIDDAEGVKVLDLSEERSSGNPSPFADIGDRGRAVLSPHEFADDIEIPAGHRIFGDPADYVVDLVIEPGLSLDESEPAGETEELLCEPGTDFGTGPVFDRSGGSGSRDIGPEKRG